jgi:hypothetical protein
MGFLMRVTTAALMLSACAVAAAHAQALSREEALASAFPGAAIQSEQVFLTAEQQKQAEAMAGTPLPSALVARYLATASGRLIGRAYVDTHVVRTKKESLLICLDAAGRVLRVEATAFLEPPEYRAPQAWTRQFNGRRLDDDLRVNRAIRPIAGATLTANAETAAVRRVLAVDRVLTGAGHP